MRRSKLALLTTAVLTLPSVGAAQPTLVGNQFVVNQYTTALQQTPRGCAKSDGEFVVVWHEPGSYQYGPDSRDGSGEGLFGRLVSGGGVPLGNDFQVHTYTSGTQGMGYPVCFNAGGFVVVWADTSSYMYPYGFSGRDGVFAQRFGADGDKVGMDIVLDEVTPTTGMTACNSPGDGFVVVWSGGGVTGKRFDSSGQPVGTSFTLNQYSAAGGKACCGGDFGFVIVWDENIYQDSDYSDVFAQRFSATGEAQGTKFQVNTYTALRQRNPAVVCNGDGSFAVAWESGEDGFSPGSQDGSSYGVFGQRFDAGGTPSGTEMHISTQTVNQQAHPSIAASAGGNFLVVWDTTTVGSEIRGQAFDAAGDPIGTEIPVNGTQPSPQVMPSVIGKTSGPFLALWHTMNLALQNDDVSGQLISLGGAATTTTTIVTTTTMMTATTTTTLPSGGVCGDPVDPANLTARVGVTTINATDALFTLKAAVGSEVCELCVCDVDTSGDITASDALFILQVGVGQPVVLECPPCA